MKKIYLIAFVVALVAALATYLFASYLDEQSRYQDAEKTDVVFAINDVPAGTEITADNVNQYFQAGQVIVDYTTPGYIADLGGIVGFVCTQDIFAGEQVSSNMFQKLEGGSLGLAYDLNEGEVAYSIEAAEVIGVDGYLEIGDTVDIVAYYEELVNFEDSYVTLYGEKVKFDDDPEQQRKLGMLNEPAFTDLEVIAVGSTQNIADAAAEGIEMASYDSVTLRTTPEVAAMIYNMENETDKKFKLILNSHTDAEKTRAENAEGAN